jgi:Na+/melibiose symporter-like transporter
MRGKLMILWIASIWIVSFIIPASRIVLARKRDEKFAVYTFCALLIISSAAFYAFTYYNLKKQSSNAAFNIQNSDETRAQKARILKEKQFLKTIIIIACISFICVVPSMVVFQLYDSLSLSDNDIYVFAFYAFTCIFYANFAVNPIIYVIRLPNYRKTFYLLYCKRRRKRQNGGGIVS